MSHSNPPESSANISHKLVNAWSRTLTEAEGGEDDCSWRLELSSNVSTMTYSLRPEGGPGLRLIVKALGCSIGEQHLANHRSAWKEGQKVFESFLRDQLEDNQDEDRRDKLEDLLWRTRAMDCPINDSRVFDSALSKRENVHTICELSRWFPSGFEQKWELTENGYEPSQWERVVLQDDTVITYAGAPSHLTISLWSRDGNRRLGEFEIIPVEWKWDGIDFAHQVNNGTILELRLDNEEDIVEDSEQKILVRLDGMSITTNTADWDIPFRVENGQVLCAPVVSLPGMNLLSPTIAQLEPERVGNWTPRSGYA